MRGWRARSSMRWDVLRSALPSGPRSGAATANRGPRRGSHLSHQLDFRLQPDAEFFKDRFLYLAYQLTHILGGRAAGVNNKIGMPFRHLGATVLLTFETRFFYQLRRCKTGWVLKDRSAIRSPDRLRFCTVTQKIFDALHYKFFFRRFQTQDRR